MVPAAAGTVEESPFNIIQTQHYSVQLHYIVIVVTVEVSPFDILYILNTNTIQLNYITSKI